MLEVPPINTWADITDQKVGTSAISHAPTASATIPAVINPRLDRRRSTNAPANGESESHALLVPPESREVDREEWSDSGLDVGEEEIQPVQTEQGSP